MYIDLSFECTFFLSTSLIKTDKVIFFYLLSCEVCGFSVLYKFIEFNQ